ncbi:MAG: biotin--[acetyl-CoA-carboxylase] ligase [Mycobacterium sp.]
MREALDVGAIRAAAHDWRVDVVEETGSTNADLLARAAAGEDIAGAVLLAEYQTAGRGRHDRQWSAPPRAQVAMSVGVDTTGIPTDTWGWLPLLTGVAAVETLREYVDAGLKWPNDVMVGTGKLGGVLSEVANAGVVVVGIGINVSLTADELPDPRATSLELLGATVDRTELASNVLRALASRVHHWRAASGADGDLVDDYKRYSLTLGTPVRAVLPGDTELRGTAVGVDEFGRLLIDDGTEIVTVAAGDITHLRPGS